MAEMTGQENSPEFSVTANQREIPQQPIRLSKAFWDELRADMLQPHQSAALDLKFQFTSLIENMYFSAPTFKMRAPQDCVWLTVKSRMILKRICINT